MRIGIIQFPGTNCERETALAVERAGMQPVHFFWNQPRELLRSFDGYLLAGGFSYEDRSRAGIIAALDPIIPLIREESEKGKPVLGICNGAQILVESGMVPGLADYIPGLGITTNKRIIDGHVAGTGFYNAWITLKLEAPAFGRAFTSAAGPDTRMTIPAAHAEGRFIIPGETLEVMNSSGMIAFRYTDRSGQADDQFPVNPNGSIENIAGITNPYGNVLALMPHPERCSEGDTVFLSMARYIEAYRERTARGESMVPVIAQAREHFNERLCIKMESKLEHGRETDISTISCSLRNHPALASLKPETLRSPDALPVYKPVPGAETLVIETIITDNEAVSVENALTQLDIPVQVGRRVHWEIRFEPSEASDSGKRAEIMKDIHASGELYNTNKEFVADGSGLSAEMMNTGLSESTSLHSTSDEISETDQTWTIMTTECEDVAGQHKQEILKDWFSLEGITEIRRSVLWTFSPLQPDASVTDSVAMRQIMQRILDSHIIMNPYTYRAFRYRETF